MRKQACFDYAASGAPDYGKLKSELSILYGVTEMNIDSKTRAVVVDYDDEYLSPGQIEESIGPVGYALSKR